MAHSPVKQVAENYGLKVLQPEKASHPQFLELLRTYDPDILIVVAFGQILKKDLLELPRWGALNMHASLLPKYRGAAPIQWAILKNEAKTGVTAMRMDEGLDTGPILLQKETPIGPCETAGQLHDRLARVAGELLVETLQGLAENRLGEKAQNLDEAVYAPKIDRSLSLIQWDRDSGQVSALIRALDPSPGACTGLGDREIKLFSPAVDERERRDPVPGRVLGYSDGMIWVEAGKGLVGVKELQVPGKRRLPASEFIRGFSLDKGTILGR